jgi:O-antigen ligase
MVISSFSKKIHYFIRKSGWLLAIELISLLLMIASLPSLEAPKNIFLVFFVISSTSRQIKYKSLHNWGNWDWFFALFILCAMLSSFFAGLGPGNEWGGFRVLLTCISVAWLISRANYSKKQINWIFWLAILSTIPPLLLGLWGKIYLHLRDLQLHSVGHVNHSAIYLSIIFGASFSATLSNWSSSDKFSKFLLIAFTLLFYIGIVMSESRAAVLVSSLSALLLILLIPNDRNRKILWAFILAFSVVILFLAHTPVATKQIELTKQNNFLSFRDKVWNVPLEIYKSYPLLGIGMNNWKFITLDMLEESRKKKNLVFDSNDYYLKAGHAHNLYLQCLLERGLVGLISMIGFAFFWSRELVLNRNMLRNTPMGSYLWGGSLSALLVTFFIGFVNSTLHHEHGILACIFLGLFLSFRAKKDSSDNSNPKSKLNKSSISANKK